MLSSCINHYCSNFLSPRIFVSLFHVIFLSFVIWDLIVLFVWLLGIYIFFTLYERISNWLHVLRHITYVFVQNEVYVIFTMVMDLLYVEVCYFLNAVVCMLEKKNNNTEKLFRHFGTLIFLLVWFLPEVARKII